MELAGKVVVVTGGFGTLGAAVGKAASAQGARTALIDRAQAPFGQGTPAQALLLPGVDLGNEQQAAAAMQSVVAKFGGIDALVNVAGTFRWETLESGSADTWDLLYRVNVRTAVVTSRAVLPYLLQRAGGRIVNIGAGAAAKAAAGMGAYAASKSGVLRLTEALSEEVKTHGITVNAILPSIIDTPQNRQDMPDADFGKWVAAESIADVIVFLLSERARSVTGAAISVPGKS
jgi:NAD(P)-dependent dehydrogenase (short-subunit alcohol dehydrogenase family)